MEIVRSATVTATVSHDLVDARLLDDAFKRALHGTHKLAHFLGDLLLHVCVAQRLGAAELALIALDDFQRDFGGLAFFGRVEDECGARLLGRSPEFPAARRSRSFRRWTGP